MDTTITDWLLASDPSIAWQTSRDLLDQPESTWAPLRSQVETQGYGAELLGHQDADGQWAGAAFWPGEVTQEIFKAEGQPRTATHHVLGQLREFGLDPTSEVARRTVELVGQNCRWDHDGQRFWDGEVEECINGRTLAHGSYFGAPIEPVLETLLRDVQPDGAWNCERERGSKVSSMDSTINVLEGLLEYEIAHPERTDVRAVRERGEEYLLARHLFRKLSTGEMADPNFVKLQHPTFWQLTTLRALDHFRKAGRTYGTSPDQRLAEAIEQLRARRLDDGRWPTDGRSRGRVWFEIEGPEGSPSPWNTLVALRVLRWWDEGDAERSLV